MNATGQGGASGIERSPKKKLAGHSAHCIKTTIAKNDMPISEAHPVRISLCFLLLHFGSVVEKDIGKATLSEQVVKPSQLRKSCMLSKIPVTASRRG